MKPHPDFAERAPPPEAQLDAFRLTPLSPDAVDEDLAAVLGSERVLKGIFGGTWPEGLTRAANLIDLAWHAREFVARRSFAWILRDADGQYLGCAYLYPDLGVSGQGEGGVDARDQCKAVRAVNDPCDHLAPWLQGYLPDGYALTWRSNDQP